MRPRVPLEQQPIVKVFYQRTTDNRIQKVTTSTPASGGVTTWNAEIVSEEEVPPKLLPPPYVPPPPPKQVEQPEVWYERLTDGSVRKITKEKGIHGPYYISRPVPEDEAPPNFFFQKAQEQAPAGGPIIIKLPAGWTASVQTRQ